MSNAGAVAVAIASGIGGAAITAFFAFRAAKARIRATVVSANRLRWIHIVRNTVSELASSISVEPLSGKMVDPKELKRALFLTAKLQLLLNPEEQSTSILMEKLELYRAAIAAWQPGQDVPDAQEIIGATGVILKTEWRRVKAGD